MPGGALDLGLHDADGRATLPPPRRRHRAQSRQPRACALRKATSRQSAPVGITLPRHRKRYVTLSFEVSTGTVSQTASARPPAVAGAPRSVCCRGVRCALPARGDARVARYRPRLWVHANKPWTLGAAPPPLPAAARVACMSALQLRAPRAAGACATLPPLQQLRTRRLAKGFVALPPRGKATARRAARAGSLPDSVLEDLQRPAREQARAYLPHEVLRAAVQLSVAARGGKAARLCLSNFHVNDLLTRLTRCTAPLPCAHHDWTSSGVDVVFEAMHRAKDGDALQKSDSSPAPMPLHNVPAAQRRLLRLLDALESAAPAVLCGNDEENTSDQDRTPRHYYMAEHATERAGALVAFAAHVPDDVWLQPPETWTPCESHR